MDDDPTGGRIQGIRGRRCLYERAAKTRPNGRTDFKQQLLLGARDSAMTALRRARPRDIGPGQRCVR